MILIDREMPEKCGLCPLFHAEHPMHCQGVKADRKKKIVAPYGQPRPDWCPLHEADPDTVSRQAVLRCITASRDNIDWGQSEDGDAFLHYTAALYRTIASEEYFPPSPSRPRGHWIGDKCSECGTERAWYGAQPNFCPDCGADMRQEGGGV